MKNFMKTSSRPFKYRGCEIRREHGRYYGYAPSGIFITSGDHITVVVLAIDKFCE